MEIEENSHPLCSFPECGRKVRSKELCKTHYLQALNGEPLRPIRGWRTLGCSVEDCDRPHRSMGLCQAHYQQQKRTPRERQKRTPRWVVGLNPPTGMVAIYSLRETPDGPRHYIGSTTKPVSRSAAHRSVGRPPWLIVEVYVPEAQRYEMEQVAIEAALESCEPITNIGNASASHRISVPHTATARGF